jgi:hypothetical protein
LKRLLQTVMKKFEFFVLSMAALLMTSCAPRVVTMVRRTRLFASQKREDKASKWRH